MSIIEELEAAGEVLSPAVRAAILALEAVAARVPLLEARIAELEARLAQNSNNSSRPPSADPPGTARPKPQPRGGKPGGQTGHRGHHRSLVPEERLDAVVSCRPAECSHCGTSLVDAPEQGAAIRHQVAELPPVKAQVTEYRLHALCCPACGRTTRATLPGEVGARHFGPRLSALTALLAGRFHLSRRQSCALLEEVLEVPPSLGSVQSLLEESSRALQPAWAEVREAVRAAPVVNVDETGWRCRGRRAWIWTAVSASATLFHAGGRRSRRALRRLLGTSYAGVLGSDRWSAYKHHPPPLRQLCWAHLARDFIALEESRTAAAPLGRWGVAECVRLFRLVKRLRSGELTREALARAVVPLQARMGRLLRRMSASPVQAAGRLGRELLRLWPALWTWSRIEGVEPTNNAAERSLRKAVLWRKGSFGNVSFRGLRMTERLLTASETCRQQGRSLLAYLTQAITALRAGLPAPSILAQATH